MAEAREIVAASAMAAQAVDTADGCSPPIPCADARGCICMNMARAGLLAALDKMQEPSEAMLRADTGWLLTDKCCRDVWRAMLAELRREIAALGEEGR